MNPDQFNQHDDFMKLFLESQRGAVALGDVFGSQCQ